MLISMTTPHPKAIAALEVQLALRREQDYQKLFIEALIRDCGYQFYEFRKTPTTRPLTLCFVVQKKDVIHVSTALMHPQDHYSKRVGRFKAATAMRHGHWITLRKPSNTSAIDYLRTVFGNANTLDAI